MSKPLSTYERKMKNSKFRKAYQKSYNELLFSELIILMMEEDRMIKFKFYEMIIFLWSPI